MNQNDDIWSDDMLGRRAEAEMLHEVLVMEAKESKRTGRDQAFVLALDAAYGEGKSFFLDRFRRHLGSSHPVAFVDAWADDANDEPLLAIMSSINEALEPFLKPGSAATRWLKGATAAALPIIGKMAVGTGKTLLKKYVGEEIPDELGDLIKDKSAPKPAMSEEAVLGAIDEAGSSVSSLADRMGADMLAAYKSRQKSKETFKRNMRSLVSSIPSEGGQIIQPLFVIIDELDRCRPDYAIKVLEEVKHLFEISGVIFVIALHGDQLEKSVSAVYGEKFDSKAYLRRFFTRKYVLRRLTMKEFIKSRILSSELDRVNWNYPQLLNSQGGRAESGLFDIIDVFCLDYKVTPREFDSISEGLKIFARTWKESVPIELIYLLGLLLRNVRSLGDDASIDVLRSTDIHGGWDEGGRSQRTTLEEIWRGYDNIKSTPLSELAKANYRITYGNFVVTALEVERQERFGNRVVYGVFSLVASYSARVERFGRLLDSV